MFWTFQNIRIGLRTNTKVAANEYEVIRVNTVLCDAQRIPIRIGSQTTFATVGRGHYWCHMVTEIWVNIVSDNCLLPDGPMRYLNQWWLLIGEVLWYSSESNSTVSAQATILYDKFENHTLNITTTSPRHHWVRGSSFQAPYYFISVIFPSPCSMIMT